MDGRALHDILSESPIDRLETELVIYLLSCVNAIEVRSTATCE